MLHDKKKVRIFASRNNEDNNTKKNYDYEEGIYYRRCKGRFYRQ